MTTLHEVKELLNKNKKRLAKELLESKEVIQLIKKSMSTDLSELEKIRVKEHLLDIC